MNSWIAYLNGVADGWGETMWRACWQGGLALLLVWCLCRLLISIPPAVKVWLWRLAWLKFLVMLVIPGAIDVPVLGSERDFGLVELTEFAPGSEGIALPLANPGGLQAPTQVQTNLYLFVLWIAGIVWFVFRIGVQWRRALRLRRASHASNDPALCAACAAIAQRLRIRLPSLLESKELAAPALIGVFRPAIIFPDAKRELSTGQLQLALAHELAHLKRCDLIWLWLPMFCEALFFFHPLLWLTRREWLLHQELAADALAIRTASTPAAAYAKMLLQFVTPVRQPTFGTLGISESGKTLKRRLIAMKTIGTPTGTFTATIAGLVLAASIAAVLPWRVVAQEKAADSPGEVRRLLEENGRLRDELARMKAQMENAPAEQSRVMERIAKIRAQRQELLAQYTELHPRVKELTGQLEALEESLAAEKQAAASFQEVARNLPQQHAIYREELALAEKQLESVRRQMAAGRATQDDVLRTQREVFQLKREMSAGAKRENIRQLIREEMALVEQLLREARKRIELGITSTDYDIPLQRELLRLKRELLLLEDAATAQPQGGRN